MVRNVCVDVSLAADRQCFIYCFEQLVAFVTHMGGIQRVVRFGGAGEFDHFFGFAPASGSVNESGGEAASALFHGQRHVVTHLFEFLRGRLSLLHAKDLRAYGVVTDQHDVVDGRFAFERCGVITRQVRELAFKTGEDTAAGCHRVLRRIGRDRGEAAIARYHGRHTLGEFELHAGMAKEGAIVMRVGVYEAGRKACAARIYLAIRAACAAIGDDCRDSPGVDCDVGIEGGCCAAIEDGGVANEEIGHGYP